MTVNKRLRVGVAGAGYLGSIHARIYGRMKDVDLVGIADIDRRVGEQVAKECDCDYFEDAHSMLGRVDAVSIVVPTSAHREVAEPFLNARIPVLVEKPIAHTLVDAQRVVELAAATGTLLQIGHLERFNAGVARLCQ